VIDVTWGLRGEGYPTEVFVLAQDRPGLLRDISEVFAREKLNVLGVNTLSQRGERACSSRSGARRRSNPPHLARSGSQRCAVARRR